MEDYIKRHSDGGTPVIIRTSNTTWTSQVMNGHMIYGMYRFKGYLAIDGVNQDIGIDCLNRRTSIMDEDNLWSFSSHTLFLTDHRRYLYASRSTRSYVANAMLMPFDPLQERNTMRKLADGCQRQDHWKSSSTGLFSSCIVRT